MGSNSRHISATEKLREFLKSRSLKATPQRIAVHEAMLALEHAGADQVAAYISEHGTVQVTTATVYNILTQFSDLGLYARRMSPDNKMIFDFDASPHIHLFDSKAHNLVNVSDDGILDLISAQMRRRRFRGYKIDYAELTLVCHPTRVQKKSKEQL